MAILTRVQIQDELANLYIARQTLAELDKALNAQAATIMDKARADVEAVKAAQATARATALAAIAASEKKLNEGA